MHIKLWCLPSRSEGTLKAMFDLIVHEVACTSRFGLTSERDMLISFIPDMMQYGIGSEVHVDVSMVWDLPARTEHNRMRLAQHIRNAVQRFYPDTDVSVHVDPPVSWEKASRDSRPGGWMERSYYKGMYVRDFFSVERIRELGIVESKMATRVKNAASASCGSEALLGEFIREYMQERFRIPNLGDKGRTIIEQLFEVYGLLEAAKE